MRWLIELRKVAITELTIELKMVKASAETLQKEAERVRCLKKELNDLKTALQTTGSVQAELEKTRQDSEGLARYQARTSWI